ncbi:MAG TPA: PA domain-containing protein [Steroidobacteraceae bacterium]|nr:PA domain-containing protein [Steroidobacteraceae bacterium]
MRHLLTATKVAACAGLLIASATASAAKIELINIDPPGVGFNDPTPATPVGGNTGTTIGQQRLNAYQRALDLWGSVLKSKVPIEVVGSFSAFPPELCAGNVLAQAGAMQIFANFPKAPQQDTWYGVALANALAGEDLAPGQLGPEDDYAGADIVAQFNGGIGADDCIPGSSWYYGLDNNAPDGTIDFLNTFMHEVGHGLGFSNFISEGDGLPPAYPDFPYPDIYERHTLDTTLGKTWDQLTPEQIVASATNTAHVVWKGRQVTRSAPLVLGPWQGLRIQSPANIARDVEVGTADFGPAATPQNFHGEVAIAVDAGGASTTDGCEAIASDIAGKIALIDRGTCAFLQKAQNAQAAGAIGVLIVNNQPAGVAGMAGEDPNVTIPTLMVAKPDGDAIRANEPGVQVAFVLDPTRLAGANERNQVRLYAPAVWAPGSSISHFDTAAEPSLLMEPSITDDLKAGSNVDLTGQLFKDIGWGIESLKIGRCDTTVPNITPTGDIISSEVEQCAADTDNRGRFVGCVTHVALGLARQHFIDLKGFARMVVCSATVRHP